MGKVAAGNHRLYDTHNLYGTWMAIQTQKAQEEVLKTRGAMISRYATSMTSSFREFVYFQLMRFCRMKSIVASLSWKYCSIKKTRCSFKNRTKCCCIHGRIPVYLKLLQKLSDHFYWSPLIGSCLRVH